MKLSFQDLRRVTMAAEHASGAGAMLDDAFHQLAAGNTARHVLSDISEAFTPARGHLDRIREARTWSEGWGLAQAMDSVQTFIDDPTAMGKVGPIIALQGADSVRAARDVLRGSLTHWIGSSPRLERLTAAHDVASAAAAQAEHALNAHLHLEPVRAIRMAAQRSLGQLPGLLDGLPGLNRTRKLIERTEPLLRQGQSVDDAVKAARDLSYVRIGVRKEVLNELARLNRVADR